MKTSATYPAGSTPGPPLARLVPHHHAHHRAAQYGPWPTHPEPDATDGHGPAWTIDPAAIDSKLERVKNFLWHGNTHRAGELLDFLGADVDCLTNPTDRHLAFAAKLTEFTGYIRINAAFICNYG